MHELIEGLSGVKVIADDFALVSFGESMENAIQDHDQNLENFLQCCEEKHAQLNCEKIQLHKTEVPFIEHVASGEGLKIHPDKVRAILEIPDPEDASAVHRLIGMVTYLAKFIPKLFDITEPLRQLIRRDTEWVWSQRESFQNLKKALSKAPVLRYYSSKDEVTIQCDASWSGLGAALIQLGQPVAFASCAMTPAETQYA